MKKWILALALLALAVPGLAEEKTTVTNYNGMYWNEGWGGEAGEFTAPEFVYCRTVGAGGDPFGADVTYTGTFTLTAGTLVDTGGAATFLQWGVGDVVSFRAGDQTSGSALGSFTTTILAVTDENEVDLGPGLPGGTTVWGKVYWRDTQCNLDFGGWVNVLNWESVLFSVRYMSGGSSGGMAFVFECRTRDWAFYLPSLAAGGSAGNQLYPGIQVYPGSGSACGFGTLSTDYCVLTTPADTAPRATDSYFALQLSNTQNFYECRIGLSCETDCDTEMYYSSITVNRQEVK